MCVTGRSNSRPSFRATYDLPLPPQPTMATRSTGADPIAACGHLHGIGAGSACVPLCRDSHGAPTWWLTPLLARENVEKTRLRDLNDVRPGSLGEWAALQTAIVARVGGAWPVTTRAPSALPVKRSRVRFLSKEAAR